MGTVYLAEHALIRRTTAIKVFSPERSTPELLQRFEREVQVTAKLSHPNTVAVFDYGRQANGVFYYVMEMIDGIDLDSLVTQNGALPLGRALHVSRQLAGSLAEAHSVGVVHRDIKPANVMLTNRGGIPDFVKVLDFGLARAPDGQTKLTQAGLLLGTPLYMAPELLQGGEGASPRSDVYAAGCVLFFLLTGKDAFSATSIPAIIARHSMGNVHRLEKEMIGPCPSEIGDLVHRCIEVDPAKRYANGTELCVALEDLAYRYPWTSRDAQTAWEEQRTRAACLAPTEHALRIAEAE
jgi:eukaryotic-like serine/threonine-protein kinase